MTKLKDLTKIKAQLQKVPLQQTTYEFENFFLDQYPTESRRLVAVMQRMLEINEELEQLSTTDTTYAELQKKHLMQQYNMLSTWYNNVKNKDAILANYENEEPEYWAQTLGRTAAIEIIALGNTSQATMAKMSLLPMEDFEEAVRVCVKFASLIQTVTEAVEKDLGIKTTKAPDATKNQ